MKKLRVRLMVTYVAVLGVWAVANPAIAESAIPAKVLVTQATQAGASTVIKFRADLAPSKLLARPDTDMVEFSDGRRMKVGDLRRLTQMAKRMRTAQPKPLPPGLVTKPAGTGTPVNNANDLTAALKRGDAETLRLPSGRLITVAQLKLFKPQVEKRLGRNLQSSNQHGVQSKVVKVGATSDWGTILKMPDTTILEAPDGTQITLANIKARLAQSTKRLPPVKQ